MADAAPKTEKKARKKPEGPRTPRSIHVLLSVGEDGKPGIAVATYDASKLLSAMGPGLTYATVVPAK